MSNNKTGGPAFPVDEDAWRRGLTGMTLRDYFAAKAMQGMLAENGGGAMRNEQLADFAYEIADAMLEARNK